VYILIRRNATAKLHQILTVLVFWEESLSLMGRGHPILVSHLCCWRRSPRPKPTEVLSRPDCLDLNGQVCCCLLLHSGCKTCSPSIVPERSRASCLERSTLVVSGVPNQVQAGTGDVHNPHTSVPRLPDRFCKSLQQQ